jgi:broad specificity phosphatase PhoE
MQTQIRKILFIRHGKTTPLDKTVPASKGDPARVLTSEGVARAEEVATDLATKNFGLMITSGVPRTIQTGAIIAAKQQKLDDVMGVRSLYMPVDDAKTDKLFAIFETATTPRLAIEVPEIMDMCARQGQTILELCRIYDNPDTIVVNHMVLIQLIAYSMGAEDDVLDAKLEPCDGIEITIADEELVSWAPYSAPKAAV